jgi:hypothetical protein
MKGRIRNSSEVKLYPLLIPTELFFSFTNLNYLALS